MVIYSCPFYSSTNSNSLSYDKLIITLNNITVLSVGYFTIRLVINRIKLLVWLVEELELGSVFLGKLSPYNHLNILPVIWYSIASMGFTKEKRREHIYHCEYSLLFKIIQALTKNNF